MQRSLYILLFLIIYSTNSYTQITAITSWSECKGKEDEITNISIDFSSGNANQLCKNILKLKNLTTISIRNCELKTLPFDISSLKSLNQLIITNSPDLDYDEIFLKCSPIIESVMLDNADLEILPKGMSRQKNLKHFVLTNNDNIDLSNAIKELSKLKYLETLCLPLNQISEIPQEIRKVKNLKVLDLRYNELTDIPNSLSMISGLDSLKIEGNYFIDQVGTLEGLEQLNIKYLSMDEMSDTADINRLKELFPGANITYRSEQQNKIIKEKESPVSEEIKDTVTSEMTYLDFVNTLSDTFVYSSAYLHYPELFCKGQFKVRTDSLLFDERYSDITYEAWRKKQPFRNYRNLQITRLKRLPKGEFWFGISPTNVFLLKDFPELRVFNPYLWVYEGKMRKKKFKKLYVGTKHHPKYYHDVRIEMKSDNNAFAITLKNDTGFITLDARLRHSMIIQPDEQAYSVAAQRYKRYIKALSKKRTNINKAIINRNTMIVKEMQKAEEKAWCDFQKMYMTPDERRLSRKHWLEYYQAVIANRNRAIASATASSDNMKQFLDLNNYKPLNLAQQIQTDSSFRIINVACYDSANRRLADASAILINPSTKTYTVFKGEYGLKRIEMILSSDPNCKVFIELMNGDIALSNNDDMYNILKANQFQSNLKCETISKKMATTVMVATYLGL